MFMDMALSCDTIATSQSDTSPIRKPYYSPERTHNKFHITDSIGAAWLLGREFYLPQEFNDFLSDVKSLFWFSYRKGFKPIGGSGSLKSDAGWGCCYRCGQMLMGHTLIRNALGRDWKWRVGENGVEDMNPHYPLILSEFLDTNTACYSIHQLTCQAVDFGRDIGTWAGPNTVAQALRCRARCDPLSDVVVHVAMDMLVIRQSIRKECQTPGMRFTEEVAVEVVPLFSPLDGPVSPQTESKQNNTTDTQTQSDVAKFETNLSQSTVVLGGYEHDPDNDTWREVAPYPLAPSQPTNHLKNSPKTFQSLQNRFSNSKQFLTNIFKTDKIQKSSTSHLCFSQSLGKLPPISPASKRDITRRMSEPLSMRVNTNVNNINTEFVVVSKSSRCKSGCYSGAETVTEKPSKIQDSFQVYSMKPAQDIETHLPEVKTDMSPLESIGYPPENVSSSEPPIDTSVSSCVFVSDHNSTMDMSATSEPDVTQLFRPLLLLIPLRLGQDKFNLEYAKPLLSCFKLPQSVGIIGGRPKHALYLIGYQDEQIFYLDPHTTQSTVSTPLGSLRIPDKTFHTSHVESMHFSELDPSLAIGFFCETEAVFEDLLDQLETQVLSQKPKLFEISESIPFTFHKPKRSNAAKQEPFSLVGKDDILDDVIDLNLDEDIDEWDVINFDQFS